MDTKGKNGLYDDIHKVTQLPVQKGKESPRFVPIEGLGKGTRDKLMNERYIFTMDTKGKNGLYDDIHKVTQLPVQKGKKSPRFVPIEGLGKGTSDRLMNERYVRRPRNIELVEGDSSDSGDDNSVKFENIHDEDKLLHQINTVNRLVSLNDSTKQQKSSGSSKSVSPKNGNQTDSRSSSESMEISSTSSCNTGCDNSEVNNDTSNSRNIETHKEINFDLAKLISDSRFSRNALLIGLLKDNRITLKDLDIHVPETNGSTIASDNNTTESCPEKQNESINSKHEKKLTIDNQNLAYYAKSTVHHADVPKHSTRPSKVSGPVNNRNLVDNRCKMNGAISKQRSLSPLDDSCFAFKREKPQTSTPKPKNNDTVTKSGQVKAVQVQAQALTANPFVIRNDQFVIKNEDFPALRFGKNSR